MDKPKPKVLIAVFCGTERTHWLCPSLVDSLLKMSHHDRYSVQVEMIYSLVPTDYARNTALAMARDRKVDWLLMIDNDTAPTADPLRVIRQAPQNADVVAMAYGSMFGKECAVVAEFIPGVYSGDYLGTSKVGTGCVALRSSVWEKLPRGPWFKIVSDDENELYKPVLSEDIYFCNLAYAAGLSIWIHRTAMAAHMHSVDLTELARRK